MQETYGPFQPNSRIDVPIWLALQLYKRKKCSILPPHWMDKDGLTGRRRVQLHACRPAGTPPCSRPVSKAPRQCHARCSADAPTPDPYPCPSHAPATLAAMLEEEKSATQFFQPLPFYYIEISKLLFQGAVDAFGDSYLEVQAGRPDGDVCSLPWT